MLESVQIYLESRTATELFRDAADVVIVYYLFYRLLLVARGTRAMQVAAGLGIVALFYVLAQAMGLVTITTLVGSLLQSIILVVVVVFQNDIRRALQRVGSRAFFGGFGRAQETEVIDQVVEAARDLARHRIGAIITFEQDANLDEFIGTNKGIDIDSKVGSELLVSLFIPEGMNKLHDGAVIIRDLRIAKAGVFYPMPEGRAFDPSFGSRHRAAIGITEETDAVVVVVSEERGTISFCFNGNIASDLQPEQLKEMLFSIMNPKVRKKSRELSKRRSSVFPKERASSAEAPHSTRRGTISGEAERPAVVEPPRANESSAHSNTGPSSTAAMSRPQQLPNNLTPVPGSSHLVDDSAEAPAPLRKSIVSPPTAAEGPETSSKQDDSGDSLTMRAAKPSARPMPKGPEVPVVREPEDRDDSAEEIPRSH